MKHRSTHIFILVAAILVAAPRASQELSAMKDDLGRRLKAEIFNVFLSLHSDDVTRPAAQTAADSLLASADAPREASRPARAAGATQVEVHARREVPAEAAEVAAITEPVFDLAAVEAEAAARVAAAHDFKFELHDPKVIRGRELAMIIPPDADVTPPPPPPVHPQTARRAPAPRRRAADFETRAASFDVKFGEGLEFKSLPVEELRRQLDNVNTYRLDADAARTWTKVLKLKRTAPKPAPAAPAPAARAACPKTEAPAATSSLQVGCGPSAVETFYAGE